MDYLVKIRSVQTPLNGQFSIGANRLDFHQLADYHASRTALRRFPAHQKADNSFATKPDISIC